MRSVRCAAPMAVLAAPLAAQTPTTFEGRVVDEASRAHIPNALVTLAGHGSRLSSEGGLFGFDEVPAGRYRIEVEAFGYEDWATDLEIRSDTFVVVTLAARPVELDGLDVYLRRIDFEGLVQDPRTGGPIARARVGTDQGHQASTRLSGRFGLDDVYDGPPLLLSIRAFGYLPFDSAVVPVDDERHVFHPTVDPVMDRMIGELTATLDERVSGLVLRGRPVLTRADLASFRGNTSLRAVMESRYPLFVLRSISCFFVDEREQRLHSREEAISFLEGTFAADLHRIELLQFPGEGRLYMVRVYTSRFFQRRVGAHSDLAPPSIVPTPGGVFCR